MPDTRSLGYRGVESQNARPCHFLYPRSLKSFDLFCLSSLLSIARDERPSTIPMTERLVSAFATITCTGVAGGAINRSHLADVPYAGALVFFDRYAIKF